MKITFLLFVLTLINVNRATKTCSEKQFNEKKYKPELIYQTKYKELNASIKQLNPHLPTKFIIHGFNEDSTADFYVNISGAYLEKGEYNVIRVDYGKAAKLSFPETSIRVPYIAKEVAEFIITAHKSKVLDISKVHLVGASLGGQVAGQIGKYIDRKQKYPKVGRITALDPARLGYESLLVHHSNKLTKDDAAIVEIIHTDGGGAGYKSSAGTVDYFPNGGMEVQPGCIEGEPMNLLNMDEDDSFKIFISKDNLCSHSRAVLYFLESINSKNIIATKCDSWHDFLKGKCNENENIVFGEDAPTNARGNYYFKTRSESPFAITT